MANSFHCPPNTMQNQNKCNMWSCQIRGKSDADICVLFDEAPLSCRARNELSRSAKIKQDSVY